MPSAYERGGVPAARLALEEAEAKFRLRLIDDVDTDHLRGFFAPRGAPLSVGEVRVRARSWEAFDRAFVAAPEKEAGFVAEQLLPFIAQTGLVAGVGSRCLLRLASGHVAGFPGGAWERLSRTAEPHALDDLLDALFPR